MRLAIGRRYSRGGLLALLLAFETTAQARVMATQTLANFKVASVSGRYRLAVQAHEGTIGRFGGILAAKHASLNLQDTRLKRNSKYECDSFSFYIKDNLAICEVAATRLSHVIDLKNSEVSHYPYQP